MVYNETSKKYQRDIKIMPRNSIGFMTVRNGIPISEMKFYWRFDNKYPEHGGYFTPTNTSHFLWPIHGIMIQNSLFSFSWDVYDTGGGQFGFAFNGTTVTVVLDTSVDPAKWQYSLFHIPHTDNDLNFASASILEGNYLYLLGQRKQDAVLARISTQDLLNYSFDKMEYYQVCDNKNCWDLWPGSSALASLFTNGPSETTIQYHPYLQSWFLLTFDYFGDTIVRIKMAKELTGPWSDSQEIYKIPPPWNQSPIFCYAIKSHPEFMKNQNEIIFSFMSNLPVSDLPYQIESYIPQIIRTTIK